MCSVRRLDWLEQAWCVRGTVFPNGRSSAAVQHGEGRAERAPPLLELGAGSAGSRLWSRSCSPSDARAVRCAVQCGGGRADAPDQIRSDQIPSQPATARAAAVPQPCRSHLLGCGAAAPPLLPSRDQQGRVHTVRPVQTAGSTCPLIYLDCQVSSEQTRTLHQPSPLRTGEVVCAVDVREIDGPMRMLWPLPAVPVLCCQERSLFRLADSKHSQLAHTACSDSRATDGRTRATESVDARSGLSAVPPSARRLVCARPAAAPLCTPAPGSCQSSAARPCSVE